MTNSTALGGQRAISDRNRARVGMIHSAPGRGIESELGGRVHFRIRNLTYHDRLRIGGVKK
jgi:hypothetical protein